MTAHAEFCFIVTQYHIGFLLKTEVLKDKTVKSEEERALNEASFTTLIFI